MQGFWRIDNFIDWQLTSKISPKKTNYYSGLNGLNAAFANELYVDGGVVRTRTLNKKTNFLFSKYFDIANFYRYKKNYKKA